MGNFCACGRGKLPLDENNTKDEKPSVNKTKRLQSSDTSEQTTIIHSSEEILDEDFTKQITDAIDKYMTSVPTNYQNECNRIVNEMQRADPNPYLGLRYSDYPDRNRSTVNEMARRLVISNDVKQRLIEQIDEQIEPSFQVRTIGWDNSSQQTARPVIRTFIETQVNEAFGQLQLT